MLSLLLLAGMVFPGVCCCCHMGPPDETQSGHVLNVPENQRMLASPGAINIYLVEEANNSKNPELSDDIYREVAAFLDQKDYRMVNDSSQADFVVTLRWQERRSERSYDPAKVTLCVINRDDVTVWEGEASRWKAKTKDVRKEFAILIKRALSYWGTNGSHTSH